MTENRVGKIFIALTLIMMFLTPLNVSAKTSAPKNITKKQDSKVSALKDVILEKQEDVSFVQRVVEQDNQYDYLAASNEEALSPQGGFIKVPASEETEDLNTEKTSKFDFLNTIKKTAQDVYELQIEQTDKPAPLLKDQLSHHFEKGPLDSLHFWSGYQFNLTNSLPERGHNTTHFNMAVINLVTDAKFKGGKEGFRIMLEPSKHTNHSQYLTTLFQDVYFESSRIPHTKLFVGKVRPGYGVEGASSAYTLDFISRSQIARHYSTIRKVGLRAHGDYSLMDYDTGVYSACTRFSDFFPGQEVNGWVNFKPLGRTKGKYGKLVIGGGAQAGEKHGIGYSTEGAYAGYEYKRFKTKFEYARANGSNGATNLTNARTQGFYWTNAYKLTPKVELLTRFDQFDPNRYTKNNNNREYTLGVNYFIKGQGLRLIFNYVYGQSDSKSDSHRLMLGTQIML